VRETVVYLYGHLRFQKWDLPAAPPAAPPTEHCPECGAAVPRGATECAACGTELQDSPAARASAPT
jgi:zinc-ribbon domain